MGIRWLVIRLPSPQHAATHSISHEPITRSIRISPQDFSRTKGGVTVEMGPEPSHFVTYRSTIIAPGTVWDHDKQRLAREIFASLFVPNGENMHYYAPFAYPMIVLYLRSIAESRRQGKSTKQLQRIISLIDSDEKRPWPPPDFWEFLNKI